VVSSNVLVSSILFLLDLGVLGFDSLLLCVDLLFQLFNSFLQILELAFVGQQTSLLFFDSLGLNFLHVLFSFLKDALDEMIFKKGG
jgi:hypothetical protein